MIQLLVMYTAILMLNASFHLNFRVFEMTVPDSYLISGTSLTARPNAMVADNTSVF